MISKVNVVYQGEIFNLSLCAHTLQNTVYKSNLPSERLVDMLPLFHKLSIISAASQIWLGFQCIRFAQKQSQDERETKLRAVGNYTAEQTAHVRATGEYSNFTKTEREMAPQPLSYFLLG